MQFVSHVYFWLKAAQMDDIISGHRLAEIKARDKKTMVEALQGAGGESASHAGHGRCWQPSRDSGTDPLEGSTARGRSEDVIEGLQEPQMLSQ